MSSGAPPIVSAKASVSTASIDSSPPVASTSSPRASPTTTSGTSATGAAAETPSLPELHLAAQRGDLHNLQRLLELAGSDANERDAQNITALHWASINNQVLACKLLLEAGAEVDARGGDLNATPMHWAARNGHLYTVHLLIRYSADPTLLDSQSFNTLHLAVHSSSALLVAYVLFTLQPVAVDSTDTEGHTALHWACYQGDAFTVDLLIKAGADSRRADNAGLTPLHWAVVKGNAGCIKRLLEAGSDISTRDKLGKTAKEMAVELKSVPAYHKGLIDAGYDLDGRKLKPKLSRHKTNVAIFILPTLVFGVILNTLAILPWWSGILLVGAEFFGMHHVITKVILDGNDAPADKIMKSPYFCSIIVASIIWVSYVFVTRLVSTEYALSTLLCAVSMLVCSYNFFRAITLDPGHVPQPVGESQLKEMIEDLVESGSFDGTNFCLICMTRRPLRSKHSYTSGRCTARFDHVCPWIWNDVGVNNHRQFLLFVGFLVISIVLFIRLSIAYYTLNAPALDPTTFCILPSTLCVASHYDAFALGIILWATLQLSWTSILLGAQLWQIARQMTTLEVSNVGRYGFMGGQPSVANAAHSHHGSATASLVDQQHVHGDSCDHSAAGARPKKKSSSFLLKILGIDRFTSGKAAEGLAKSGKVSNPFDLGLIKNCGDFWTRGRELGVDYERLYEVPQGGFARAVRERKQRETEERAAGGGTASRILGLGKARPMTYERVAMNEV